MLLLSLLITFSSLTRIPVMHRRTKPPNGDNDKKRKSRNFFADLSRSGSRSVAKESPAKKINIDPWKLGGKSSQPANEGNGAGEGEGVEIGEVLPDVVGPREKAVEQEEDGKSVKFWVSTSTLAKSGSTHTCSAAV